MDSMTDRSSHNIMVQDRQDADAWSIYEDLNFLQLLAFLTPECSLQINNILPRNRSQL